MEPHESAQLFGGLSDVVAVEAQYFVGPVDGIGDRAAVDLRHRVQLVLERGDDAEVAAASAQSPEEVTVVVLACSEHFSVSSDDLGGHEVVARESVLTRKISDPPSEGQPRDPRRADDAP